MKNSWLAVALAGGASFVSANSARNFVESGESMWVMVAVGTGLVSISMVIIDAADRIVRAIKEKQ